MRDDLGAFVGHDPIELAGAESGPLVGATFAVKNIFDVAGARTGCGNPERLAAAKPAAANAPAVQALLDAGARLVGKTITDELAFSINGENVHYGTPLNSKAPQRSPAAHRAARLPPSPVGPCRWRWEPIPAVPSACRPRSAGSTASARPMAAFRWTA
jgi:hypothetical protein